jgi:hypothetical protein
MASSVALLVVFLFALSACDGSMVMPVPPIRTAPMKFGSDVMHASDYPFRPLTLAGATGEPSEGVVVIQGIFDPAGDRLIELQPVRRFSWRSGPTPNQQAGRFMVEVMYVTGQSVTVPFDALVADDSGRTSHGFFEVVVPVHGEIASIRITDASRQRTFARIDGSEIQP